MYERLLDFEGASNIIAFKRLCLNRPDFVQKILMEIIKERDSLQTQLGSANLEIVKIKKLGKPVVVPGPVTFKEAKKEPKPAPKKITKRTRKRTKRKK